MVRASIDTIARAINLRIVTHSPPLMTAASDTAARPLTSSFSKTKDTTGERCLAHLPSWLMKFPSRGETSQPARGRRASHTKCGRYARDDEPACQPRICQVRGGGKPHKHLGLSCFKRLGEIGLEGFDVIDTHRKPQQTVLEADPEALFAGHERVRHRRRM